MSIDVYFISGSAPAWRVLLALEVKGLTYQPRVLETSKKEQKEAWFLEINPRGQIPVIKDGEVVVTESLAILHYLEKRNPDPAIFGETPKQTAEVEQTVHEISKAPELADDMKLDNLGTAYPALMTWNQRTEALPAFEVTFPPHWRD